MPQINEFHWSFFSFKNLIILLISFTLINSMSSFSTFLQSFKNFEYKFFSLTL